MTLFNAHLGTSKKHSTCQSHCLFEVTGKRFNADYISNQVNSPRFHVVACIMRGVRDTSAEISIGTKVYFPMRQIQSTAKGEVLLGACGSTAAPVIIKTALKGVFGDPIGLDAIDRLTNEFRTLSSLHILGGKDLAPIPIGFEMGNPAVLIMEDVPGTPLHQLPRDDQVRGVVAMMRSMLGFMP